MVIKRKRSSRCLKVKLQIDKECEMNETILNNIKAEIGEEEPHIKVEVDEEESPGDSSGLSSQNANELQENMEEVHRNVSEFSQIKLITMASGSTKKDPDNLWTRSRSLLRKKNTSELMKAKARAEYYRNDFHLSLKDKWSKVLTNKVSALAFTRSLQGAKGSTFVS